MNRQLYNYYNIIQESPQMNFLRKKNLEIKNINMYSNVFVFLFFLKLVSSYFHIKIYCAQTFILI